MKKTFFVFCLSTLLLFCLLIITCKKEFSYEGGRMAEYELTGSPQECTEAIVAGNYYTGVALDSTNKVQLMTHVTVPGNYDLTTNMVDGISFSASGMFADTGFQSVVLSGNGMPDSSGNFIIKIPGTEGCFFAFYVTNEPGAEFILSGAPGNCENPLIEGDYTKGIALTATNTVVVVVDVVTTGKYQIKTNTANGISFSAAGEFLYRGSQQVTLTGSGKPESSELTYFTLDAGSSQCGFYIPVGVSGQVATYVLQSGFGDINPCTPSSIQGIYTANTPLAGNNTVTVNAYVTVPGDYTISTKKINGVQFQSSGTFAVAGTYDVVLKGSGTPTASGTFTFVPQIVGPAPLGGSSCGISILVQ